MTALSLTKSEEKLIQEINESTHHEGWMLVFAQREVETLEIQRDDYKEIFKCDNDAMLFVIGQAKLGSKLHKKAIGLICKYGDTEERQVLKNLTEIFDTVTYKFDDLDATAKKKAIADAAVDLSVAQAEICKEFGAFTEAYVIEYLTDCEFDFKGNGEIAETDYSTYKLTQVYIPSLNRFVSTHVKQS